MTGIKDNSKIIRHALEIPRAFAGFNEFTTRIGTIYPIRSVEKIEHP